MKKILLTLILLLMAVPVYAGWQDTPQAQPYQYGLASGATVHTFKTGIGVIHTLVVTGGTAGTIDIYDSTSASGTPMYSFASTNTPNTYLLDVGFSSGCTVVTGGVLKYTISYL